MQSWLVYIVDPVAVAVHVYIVPVVPAIVVIVALPPLASLTLD